MNRTMSNSVAAAVKAAGDVKLPALVPPEFAPLTEAAKAFWPAVMRSRARDEWTESDLIIGSQLAQCMSDIVQEDARVRQEGRVIRQGAGSGERTAVNPRVTVLERLAARQLSLMRSLRITGALLVGTGAAPKYPNGARRAEVNARTVAQESESEDDLLA